MAQYALPNVDDAVIDWSEGAGDGDGDAFDEIDEGFGAGRGSGSGPDGATTYWVNDGVVSRILRFEIETVTDPLSSTGHIIRAQWSKSASGGRQIDMTQRIRNLTTTRASSVETDVSNTFSIDAYPLSGAEADSVDSYSNLLHDGFGSEVGGGGPRDPQISAFEFECPDAAPAAEPFLPRRAHKENTLLRM